MGPKAEKDYPLTEYSMYDPSLSFKNPLVSAYFHKYHLNCGRLHGRRLELPVLAKQKEHLRGAETGLFCGMSELSIRLAFFNHFGIRHWFHDRLSSTGLGWGVVWGWFKDITFIVCFVSNLMPPLIWQEVPVHSPEVGDPCIRYPTEDVE